MKESCRDGEGSFDERCPQLVEKKFDGRRHNGRNIIAEGGVGEVGESANVRCNDDSL